MFRPREDDRQKPLATYLSIYFLLCYLPSIILFRLTKVPSKTENVVKVGLLGSYF